ncbi:glycoprotease family protein [Daldinia sp. FL1419]|nr:glycoprotease family protein [Daldinia sp. FL1419]
MLVRLGHRPPTQNLSWHTQRILKSQRRLLSTKSQPRPLVTLAIESSCDDTCVTVLEKDRGVGRGAARLLFDKKITSDNREFRGVRPVTAVASHTQHLAGMVREAMRALPDVGVAETRHEATEEDVLWVEGRPRRKPDFVTVTRGPGMMSNLSTGLNTAKGLAVAWGVPLLAVHHMQAHALTPRLVGALEAGKQRSVWDEEQQKGQVPIGEEKGRGIPGQNETNQPILTPAFPFLSLLVSGGHTLLVLSRSLTNHAILASAQNIAIGDMLDKCARDIIPASELARSSGVMYAAHLERFAFPNGPSDYAYTPPAARAEETKIYDPGLGWKLTPPLSGSADMSFEYAGFNGQVIKIMMENPDMDLSERRLLARHTMRLAFEHLASRLLLALSRSGVAGEGEGEGEDSALLREVRTLVVAGGVASNRYLMHILRSILDIRGYGHMELVCPPLPLCTDNGAMIAWTGMEMYEAGWRSELDILAIKKWPLDPNIEDGGILGAPGWRNVVETDS